MDDPRDENAEKDGVGVVVLVGRRSEASWWGVVAGVGIAVTLILIMVPRMGRRCALPAWTRCEMDVRSIGIGMEEYARDHSDRFPDRVEKLWAGTHPYVRVADVGWLADREWGRPKATTRPAREVVGDADVAHWYVGEWATRQSDPGTVLFVEQCWAHRDGSLHYLSVGGGGMLKAGEAKVLLGQVRRGVRPVVWPLRMAAQGVKNRGVIAGG